MELFVGDSDDLDAATRAALRKLGDQAFGDLFSGDDADRTYGGVHVLMFEDERLVGHASAVPRRLSFNQGRWPPVGYVKAVAAHPDRQGQGIGRGLMNRLHAEIAARWPVALLSTGRATGFYEALGWERWRGLSYTRTAPAVVADGEYGGLMILRPDRSLVPDLSVEVTCEDRSGDA